jgi:peroxiredoxin family protein
MLMESAIKPAEVVTPSQPTAQDGGALLARLEQLEKELEDLKARTPEDRATIVVFSGDLDKVLASFVIATGAAAAGMQTSMFFTFWGLNAIRKKGASTKAKDWLRRMFGLLNRGGADTLPLSRFHFFGVCTGMMKQVMQQHRMPGIPELMETAQDLGVRFIACTTTMGLMGITKDTLIEGVDQLAGVTTYLAEAKQGSVNLFI